MGCSGIRRAVATAAVLTVALAATAPASADTTCIFDAGADTLTVNMSETGDSTVLIVGAGGTIDLVPATACTGGTATVTTIDDINVFDNSGTGNTRVDIRQPQTFAPGSVIEEGNAAFSEIEFNIAPGGGTSDLITIAGESSTDIWRFGNSGLNMNVGVGADDLEIVSVGQPDVWTLRGNDAGDNISGQGGNGAGTAFTGAARLEIIGDDGGDVIRGGDSAATGDILDGLAGNDDVFGFAGNDIVGGGAGSNSLDGGPGIDDASFTGADFLHGRSGDHRASRPTRPGDVNTLTALENLIGSDGSDVLIGDAGPNTINGRDGLDAIDGRGGDDVLIDSADGATLTYAQAPAGVSVNLAAGTATGGAGTDTLTGSFTNLIGSQFADSLTGNALGNSITGLGGSDTISALAGADSVSHPRRRTRHGNVRFRTRHRGRRPGERRCGQRRLRDRRLPGRDTAERRRRRRRGRRRRRCRDQLRPHRQGKAEAAEAEGGGRQGELPT